MTGGLLNTQLIDRRRTELNMSVHALNQAAALSHRVNHAGPPGRKAHAAMTLTELSRLAATLGVPPAALLALPDQPTPGPPADDVATLVAALMDEAQVTLTHSDDVARTLGWSLERLEAAARQAAEHLPALGLHLHHNPHGGLAVRARHGVLSAAEQQQLARAKTSRADLRADHAQMLRDIAHGKIHSAQWKRTLGLRAWVPQAGLLKRGLIEDTPTGMQLTATVAYSLMLTDEPPAGSRPPVSASA